VRIPYRYPALRRCGPVLLLLLGGCAGTSMPLPPPPGDDPMVDQVAPALIPPAPVRPPAEALADLLVEDGFTVELVAHEPLVSDPVALAFDGDGAMFVVEMRGYMATLDGQGEDAPVGRIRVLQDTDGDGFYEHATTFLDSLVLPRAVLPLASGVLVAEPPNLSFYERHGYTAGRRTVVDAHYADTGGDPEHLPNGLLWARDNWIYSAKSSIRYRYRNGAWERDSTAFRGQWGLSQDDDGRLFYNHNSATLLGDDFLPNTFPQNPHHRTATRTPYGAQKVTNRVYPRRMTPGVNRAYRKGTLDAEHKLVNVTSACGPVVYRGDQFPPDFYGQAFVPEPAAYLVKRVVLADSSGHVVGRLPYEGREFLSATDERFRPVNAYTAPDGSLFVVDMYRGVIQHKTYLTDYLRRQVGYRQLEAPRGLGRIYRVRYQGRPLGRAPRLEHAPSDTLVAALGHPNGWWRDAAQRLLVERGDLSVLPVLERLAVDATQPQRQLHALWTLEGLSALRAPLLEQAAVAGDDGLRATIAQLAPTLPQAPTALRLLSTLAEAAVPDVDLAVVLALHRLHARLPDATDALLAQMAVHHGGEALFRDALLGGLTDRESAFERRLAAQPQAPPAAFTDALAQARINAQIKPVALADVLSPEEVAHLPEGEALYARHCAACHGPDGRGIDGLAPPLVRSHWVLQDEATLVRLTLDGLAGPVAVDGRPYAPPAIAPLMPGHRALLGDSELARLLTFVRNGWGNRAPALPPETVAQVRASSAARAGTAWTPDELTRLADTAPGWTPLFNGRSLRGWTRIGGTAAYTVQDHTLVGTTRRGTPNTFLATDQSYADFILELEFQVDSLINSGIQVRSNQYADYQQGRVHGYQVEIDPSPRAWTGGLYEEGRRGWLFDLTGQPTAQQAFRKHGWNHFRIEARGPHLRTWLNGVLAADLIDMRTASGFIALQVHSVEQPHLAGRQVRWRNLRLRDLSTQVVTASTDPAATPLTAATDGNPATYWQADSLGAWLQFDLRQPTPLAGVTVDFHAGTRRRYRFSVATSSDGRRWKTMIAGESRGTGLPETFPFPATQARYVRLTGNGNTEDATTAWNEVTLVRR
jgi:mono/diheme cytochrome c family protein/glucose/arabinose dehydrogenase